MPSPEELRVLREEIETDLAAVGDWIGELAAARKGLSSESSQKDLAYVAYLLHGIYTGWESAMRRIAATFENRLDPAQWHAQLLQRMTLDLPGIRPRVIEAELRLPLQKLRSFRHFFRHNYGVALDWAELQLVLKAFDAAAPKMEPSFVRFLGDVAKMVDLAEKSEP